MTIPSFRDVYVHGTRTLRRFPIEVLIALVGTIAAISMVVNDNNGIQSIDDSRDATRPILACVILLSTSLSLTITREAGRVSWLVQIGTFALAIAATVWYVLQFSFAQWDELQFAVIVVAVHVLVALSAMWNRDRTEFWEVNKTMFLRCLTAVLFTVALGGGLNLALLALDRLFDVNVGSDWYASTWCILVGLFQTWFVLAGIPETSSREHEPTAANYPKGLRIFVQYVLLPLVVIFLAILYAYGIKVVFISDLNGAVSNFIIVLAVVGTLSFLLLYPLRDDPDHAWIRVYSSWFGRAMLPLCVLLWTALIVRVQAYGITEERYLGLALAAVLTVIALYLAVVRNSDLRVVPVTLFLACIVCLSGPVGMLDVSYRSQTRRAEHVLAAAGVLHDGKYDIEKAQSMSTHDKYIVQSTLDYLSTYDSNARLERWLTSINANDMPQRHTVKIGVYMGVWTETKEVRTWGFSIGDGSTSRTAHAVSHMKGASITPFALNWNQPVSRSEDTLRIDHNGTWLFEVLRSKGTMWRLQDPTGRADTFDLATVLTQISDRSDTTTLSVNLQSDKFPDYNVALVLSRLNGSASNGTWEEVFARGVLVTTPK